MAKQCYFAVMREEFKNTKLSMENLTKILHGPKLTLIDNSPALTFEKVLNAEAWVLLMEQHFGYNQSLLVGAENDTLVKEFSSFRIPRELHTLICAVCDGRCVYDNGDWKTIDIGKAKTTEIFATIDALQLED